VEVGLNKEEWRIHYGDVLDKKSGEKIDIDEVHENE
jgi:hypothetical protein